MGFPVLYSVGIFDQDFSYGFQLEVIVHQLIISSALPKVLGQMKTSDNLTQLDRKEIDQSGKSRQWLLTFLVTFLHCLNSFSHISFPFILPNRFGKNPSLSAACGAFSQACVGWKMSLRLLSEPTKQKGTTWIPGFRITADGRNEAEPLLGWTKHFNSREIYDINWLYNCTPIV